MNEIDNYISDGGLLQVLLDLALIAVNRDGRLRVDQAREGSHLIEKHVLPYNTAQSVELSRVRMG